MIAVAHYSYDGSFDGLLSCIFEIYSIKKIPLSIFPQQNQQTNLLEEAISITTDEEKATRVLTGINARTNGHAATLVYKMYLAELPAIEMTIYHFIDIIIKNNNPAILENFANQYILQAAQIQRMIHREVHRMHAFVRFQKNNSGIFYAAITPDFNVLPLIGDHFERRYADQRWIIFDTKRDYGLYYDLNGTRFITLDDPILNQHMDNSSALEVSDNEKAYQILWSSYFQSVNIAARKNVKLHLRHMPKRYWKYLVEKHPANKNAMDVSFDKSIRRKKVGI